MARKLIKGSSVEVVSINDIEYKPPAQKTVTQFGWSALYPQATVSSTTKSTAVSTGLISSEAAKVVDLVSEGEIEGLVGGLSSVYLNGVPVQEPADYAAGNNKYNFQDVTLEANTGTPYPAPLANFTGIYSDTAVGTEIRVGSGPLIRTILDTNGVDAVKLTFSTPALFYSNSAGGTDAQTVSLKVEYKSREDAAYKDAPIREVWGSSQLVNKTGNIKTSSTPVNACKLSITWTYPLVPTSSYGYNFSTKWYQSALLQYRLKDATTAWIDLKVLEFSGKYTQVINQTNSNSVLDRILGNQYTNYPATSQKEIIINTDLANIYEFRIIPITTANTHNIDTTKSTITIPAVSFKTYDSQVTFSGKALNKYQRTYIVPLKGKGPYDIKVTRITADATDTRVQNKTFWDSYAAIYYEKLNYPNSALMGIEFDAKQFPSIPQRAYEIKGIKVAIPSNYNTITRQYNATPNISIVGGGGSGAKAVCSINSSGQITSVTIISSGKGYTSAPRVYATGCGGSGATFTASWDSTTGQVSAITITNGGSGYTNTIWDGKFKTEYREILENNVLVDREFIAKEWTDNPAWVLFDLLSNNRYGLGDYLNVRNTPINLSNPKYGNNINTPGYPIDIYALYNIAQYCDELVPTGFNTSTIPDLEPRFTCNLYLQTQEEAFTVINNIASIFRGMLYWSGGQLTAIQDRPSSMIALYTNSNVINGMFEYSGVGIKGRHTVAQITWNDPKNFYKQNIEYVESPEGIIRYGYIPTSIVAMGCTSRSQAHRVGAWLLYTEETESDTVSFKTGLDGALVYPGAIIGIRDKYRTGVRLGGRIVSTGTNTVELDGTINFESGKAYTLVFINIDGTTSSPYSIINPNTETANITLETTIATAPLPGAVWSISVSDLAIEQWRVFSISENDGGTTLTINATRYNPEKFTAVEANDLNLEMPIQTYLAVEKVGIISNLLATDSIFLVGPKQFGNKLLLSWDVEGTVAFYKVKYRTNDGTTQGLWREETVLGNSFEISQDIQETRYEIEVTAYNNLNYNSTPISIFYTVLGKKALPANITYGTIVTNNYGVYLTWDAIPDVDLDYYEIREGTTWASSTLIGKSFSNNYQIDFPSVGEHTYLIKAVDTSGNYSENA